MAPVSSGKAISMLISGIGESIRPEVPENKLIPQINSDKKIKYLFFFFNEYSFSL